MKLGFVSAIVPEMSLDALLAFASETGFDSVEAMCRPVERAARRYAGVSHMDVSDFTSSKAEVVRATIAKHGVAISALGYYPNPLSANEEESQLAIAHLKRVIEAAAQLEIRLVNTFVGRDRMRTVDEN